MNDRERIDERQRRDAMTRMAWCKRGWGASLSRHWLWLALLVLGVIATAILLGSMWWDPGRAR